MNMTNIPFDIDYAAYLSQHDIIFLSPPYHGWEGLPIGNGQMGGPLWIDERGLCFQLNHTDTWEESDKSKLSRPVLRSCGRLRIQHTVPGYNWLYLRDFEARLSMYRAEAAVQNSSEFGRFKTRAYVHADKPVCVFEHKTVYAGALAESGAPITVSFERWGSPPFSHWYRHLDRQTGQGLGTAKAGLDDNTLWMEQIYNGLKTAIALRVQGVKAVPKIAHDHCVEFEISASGIQEFRILAACVTEHDAPDPRAAAFACLDDFEKESSAETDAAHHKWWADFWGKSFLHISNDYYENLYYLYLYLMGSSSRGKYPPVFNGALWTWNHDVRNWQGPQFWNQQQLTWPLFAANRLELLAPTLETYFRLMDKMSERARELGRDGIFLAEAHDFTGIFVRGGYNEDNLTPAPQMAMQFWWCYQYGGDRQFLAKRAYPFMSAAADMYLGLLKKDEQRGEYYLPYSTTYESHDDWRFKNAITDISMIKVLLKALVEASLILRTDPDKRQKWQDVLDHLPEIMLNDHDKARGETLASGILTGSNKSDEQKKACGYVISTWSGKGKIGDVPDKEEHNHGPLFCPVFPAGDIGLKDKGNPIFNAECHTLKTYYPESNAINPLVIVAARLGMTEECVKRLETIVRNIQHFPNGLFYNIDHWYCLSRRRDSSQDKRYGGEYCMIPLAEDHVRCQRDYMEDRGCLYKDVTVTTSKGERTYKADIPAVPFIQPGMETMAHFTAGIQEMLLQSHDGIIRVFPAVPDKWEGAFTLLAKGGFLVSSSRKAGAVPEFIHIHSRRGGPCRVVNCWNKTAQVLRWQDSGWTQTAPVAENSGIIIFETETGESYIIMPSGASWPETICLSGEQNKGPKKYHEAGLGKERNY